MKEKIFREYFRLKWEDRIETYKQIEESNDPNFNTKNYRKNGYIKQYYIDKISSILNYKVSYMDIEDAKIHFQKYATIRKQYYHKDRESFFVYENIA